MGKERNTLVLGLLGAAFAVTVAIIAAVVFGGGTDEHEQEQEPEAEAPVGFEDSSVVQTEINALEWIIPMPLTVNEFSRPGLPIDEVSGIVIHNIGNPGTTAEQNRNYFERLSVSGETSVSSNFIVCLNGDIVQCIPVDEVAYASNTRNFDTLSIEVCHPDDTGEFNAEAYESVVRLSAFLCSRYGLTTDDIIRHYDITGKECPRFYVQNEDAWEKLKADIAAAMGNVGSIGS